MSDIPGVGDPLPDIAMETTNAGKKLVVFFYPKDSTPGCTTENQDFSGLKPEFDKAGVAQLGVSTDPPRKHLGFIAKYDLTAPLASDAEGSGLSDALGIWTEKQNYGRTYMGMVRTTYLVGSDGKIVRIWNKVKVKGHAAEVLEATKAL